MTDIHLLSSAAFSFPLSRAQYAAHPIPSLQEFQSLWAAWDITTKAMVPREELLSKPIKLRNALIFYLGHIPTFMGGNPTHPKSYQLIFERGIDPDVDNPEKCHAHSEIPAEWPALSDILDYQERVRNRVKFILEMEGLDNNRLMAEALWIGFEHEAMHLETFLYMLLQSDKTLPPPAVQRPDFERIFHDARKHAKPNEWFTIPAQTMTIGLEDQDDGSLPQATFGWDNEKPERVVAAEAFEAQARPITNGEYAKFLQAKQLRRWPASWALSHCDENFPISSGVSQSSLHASRDFMSNFAVRTVFCLVPLELAQDWPVMASYNELAEYAEWMGCRIPTFEEVKSIYLHAEQLRRPNGSALNGHGSEPERLNGEKSYLNGNRPRTPDHQPVQPPSRGALPVFVDLNGCNVGFTHWHPTPVIQDGNRLAGHGELGGVWEWCSTALTPYEGFKAMDIYPGYTADFFDGKHNIVLGGSWATHPRIAGRTTVVNWYQHNYLYPWAGARLVRDL
ncbi:hypothetical protein EYZ11_009990 [Aspergillus tanneri]|uniref:Sulfatase-modifying factor enzyme-like domain-containing protein n=1 Tax=Aspergillus tanneri TaxID=1220188 RepID=A0A4S3J6I0_9EURO|nr:hypothetical protein EYZ11_009990 [Aspergillus tanneri]